MSAKMKLNLNWGKKNTSATYRVEGADLEAAANSMNGREEWGLFESHLPYKWDSDAQGNATSVTLQPTFTITMPSWPAYRDQPQQCQDQWDAMWRALRKHEGGHSDLFEKGVAKVVRKLESLEPTTGADVDKLMTQTESDLQSEQNSYDTRTDHGKSQGVELTITQQCKAKPKDD